MKSIFTFLCSLLLPLFCFCQINTSLDFVGGIDYGYRNMRTVKNPGFSDTLIVRIFDENETGKINFRFGFNFNQRLSRNIFFKTGIRFASVGYQRKYEDSGLRWGNQQTGGVFDPDAPSNELPDISKLVYSYSFIEIPLIARYEFSQKKFTPFVALGIAPSIFLKHQLKLTTDTGESQILNKNNPDDNYSTVNIVGVFSFGGNYTIGENLQVFAQPTFRYHFTRLYKYGSVKEYLWNAGLEVGLRKRLN